MVEVPAYYAVFILHNRISAFDHPHNICRMAGLALQRQMQAELLLGGKGKRLRLPFTQRSSENLFCRLFLTREDAVRERQSSRNGGHYRTSELRFEFRYLISRTVCAEGQRNPA